MVQAIVVVEVVLIVLIVVVVRRDRIWVDLASQRLAHVTEPRREVQRRHGIILKLGRNAQTNLGSCAPRKTGKMDESG